MSVVPTVDSAQFLINHLIERLQRYNDYLAILGLLLAAKLTWKTLIFIRNVISYWLPRRSNLARYGKWAVVTGCSRGVGKAYCSELAKRGLNIVLISKSDSQPVAAELEKQFGTETIVKQVDLNSLSESAIDELVSIFRDLDIGILVNNAGVMFDYPQYFLEVPSTKIEEIISVNIRAATTMIRLLLPEMVKQKRGLIVNMASSAGYRPTPLMSVYAASKTYLEWVSIALNREYASHGVHVQCFVPYYIATGMTSYSNTLSSNALFVPKPEVFARHAVSQFGRHARSTGYWTHSIQRSFLALMPESVWLYGGFIMNKLLRKEGEQSLRKKD